MRRKERERERWRGAINKAGLAEKMESPGQWARGVGKRKSQANITIVRTQQRVTAGQLSVLPMLPEVMDIRNECKRCGDKEHVARS